MHISLENLRRQAKNLKRDFADNKPEAVNRARSVFPETSELKHTDALHVVARENGYASWPRLKIAAELATLDRSKRIERLKIALYYGQHWVTEALLTDDPELVNEDLGLQIAVYDRAAVERAIARDQKAAVRKIGTRSPILHLAFSQHIHAAPELRDDMIAIAEALVQNGADIDDSYALETGSEHRLSALYGALGHANNMPLAEFLLDRGANPNDNESLYHSTELGHHDGLKLLLKHGADPAGTNALPRALDFDDIEAVRLLLEAGADPNDGTAPHPSGEPPTTIPALHQAARRMCSGELATLLIEHGADGRMAFGGHSAYALACMYGNAPARAAMAAAGHATELDASESLLAAAADGQATGTVDPDRLTGEARRIMCRIAAMPDRLNHIKSLVAIGISPNWSDEMGMTAIHVAGWEGLADSVEWLLNFDPDLTHKNKYGGDLLGTIIHGSEFCPARNMRYHIACAGMVLDSGAVLRRSAIELCGAEEMAGFLADWASAHPTQMIEDKST
ncbi:MAG: ankyrin repeat domain-containing protein [Pseudomonadota bacterium]